MKNTKNVAKKVSGKGHLTSTEVNPFVLNEKFHLKVIEVNNTHYRADIRDVNLDEGFIKKAEKVTNTFTAEQQEKASVYYIPRVEELLFQHMPSCGRDLLLYIIYNLKKDCDTINLKYEKVCKEMNVSKPTLCKSLKILVSLDFIKEKAQSVYWINPYFLFKGSRQAYYHRVSPESIEVVHSIENTINGLELQKLKSAPLRPNGVKIEKSKFSFS